MRAIGRKFIVDPVITYTLSIGAVRKPHLPGVESVYLFLEFTIISHAFMSPFPDLTIAPSGNAHVFPVGSFGTTLNFAGLRFCTMLLLKAC